MRVCQFRHDGKWTLHHDGQRPSYQEELTSFYRGAIICQTAPGADSSA